MMEAWESFSIYLTTGLWLLHIVMVVSLAVFTYNSGLRVLQVLKTAGVTKKAPPWKLLSYRTLLLCNLVILAAHNFFYLSELFSNYMYMLVVFGTTILTPVPALACMTAYLTYMPVKHKNTYKMEQQAEGVQGKNRVGALGNIVTILIYIATFAGWALLLGGYLLQVFAMVVLA